MSLGGVGVWNIDLHLLALKYHSISKHSYRQILIKDGVSTLGILVAAVVGDVCSAARLCQQVVLLDCGCRISTSYATPYGVHSFELLGGGARRLLLGIRIYSGRLIEPLLYLVAPFIDIEVVVNPRSSLAPLHAVGVVDILQMGAYGHLIFLVVLVNCQLVAPHWSKRYPVLFIEAPAVELPTELRGFELVDHALEIGGVGVLVILRDIVTFVEVTHIRALRALCVLGCLDFRGWCGLLLDLASLDVGHETLEVTPNEVLTVEMGRQLLPLIDTLDRR